MNSLRRKMLTKTCDLCKESLPKNQFTSMRAKYCKKCLIIHKLEKRNEMTLRSLARTKVKKQKTVGIIRISDLKKEAQKQFNKYIRLRDKGLPCISCGTMQATAWHAGHYWAQGMNGALRYEPLNVHLQCAGCNVWKHGNLLNYRFGLINKIGEDLVDWLDENHGEVKKWNRQELESMISEYKEKIKKLENDIIS